MALTKEGVRTYMAQLKSAVRTWWQAVGPANNLPFQFGRAGGSRGTTHEPGLANGQLFDAPDPAGLVAGASRADVCRWQLDISDPI
jgi:hypothetical protein